MPKTTKQQTPTVASGPQPAATPQFVKRKISALFFLPDVDISRSMLEEIKKILDGYQGSQIYLVVKSHGGDAYSAVRILKHIRTKCKTIIGVIPDYAYSAATLMLLGTNKLLVSPEGYMGPIDKPMEHTPTGDPISALDMTQSLSNLASLVSQQARSFYKELRSSDFPDTISKKEALDTSWEFAMRLVEPLIEKIDPILLQKAYRDLRIGTYYGMDLLAEGMLPGKSNKCFNIVNRLVNIYPSHGYAIFREEMRGLGLIVEDLEKCADQQKLLEIYNISSNGIKFIEDIYA